MNDQRLKIDWQAISDPGSVREVNEDSFIAKPDSGVWAVADGMGGHESGDWASAQVIAAIETCAVESDFSCLVENCANSIHRANATVVNAAGAKGIRMGSTVAALVISGRQFGAVWAGDSRVYLLRNRILHQLTRDHTQVQEMVDRGLISPESARDHPMAHILTRAVGAAPELEVDAIADVIIPGDIFLVCTDGLYGTLSDDELSYALAHEPLENVTQHLLDRCLERGANDNVTVIVVRAQEPTMLVFYPKPCVAMP
jgi:serine/threonine protein phosphatase Stp1